MTQYPGDTPITLEIQFIQDLNTISQVTYPNLARVCDRFCDVKDKILDRAIQDEIIQKEKKNNQIVLSTNRQIITDKISFLKTNQINWLTKKLQLTIDFSYRGG